MSRSILMILAATLALGGCAKAPAASQATVLDAAPAAASTSTVSFATSTVAYGNVRGFVFGPAGDKQPIPAAQVAIGSLSTKTAAPEQANVKSDTDDGVAVEDVMHDFQDGQGSVLTERRMLKKPASSAPSDKYVYLHSGEYFLEQVPWGTASLVASFGDVKSAPQPLLVYPNETSSDLDVTLDFQSPLINEDGSTPHIAALASYTPPIGFAVTLGATPSFQPSSLQSSIALQAAPGSGAVTVAGYKVAYAPAGATGGSAASGASTAVGPVTLSASSGTQPGVSASVNVALDPAAIAKCFQASPQPDVVLATVQFVDQSGKAIMDQTLAPLSVAIAIRRQ